MPLEPSRFQASTEKQSSSTLAPWRTIALGLVLVPLNCYWVVMSEDIWNAGHPTLTTLFFNTVFSLFVLLLINRLLQKIPPLRAMRREELLTIYAMLCVATSIAGHHFLPLLVPTIPYAHWFATPENEWAQLIHPHVPPWLTVSDNRAMQGYFVGQSTLYTDQHLFAWMLPVFWWSLFILALLTGMLCLCVIVRKQWVEREKLAYPVIQVPLVMTQGKSRVFKSKLLWAGICHCCGNRYSQRTPLSIPGCSLLARQTAQYWSTFHGAALERYRLDSHFVLSLRHRHEFFPAAGSFLFSVVFLSL